MGLKAPVRLVLMSLAGALLVAGGLLGMGHRRGPFHWNPGWLWLSLSALGVVCLLWSTRVLQKGVKTGRWQAEAVEQARTVTRHPLWTAGIFGCFLAMLGIAVVTAIDRHGYHMLPFLLGLTMAQVSMMLRRESDDPLLPPSMNLAAQSSLRSEHWGER